MNNIILTNNLFFLNDIKLIDNYNEIKKEITEKNIKYIERENQNQTYKKIIINDAIFTGHQCSLEYESFFHIISEKWKNKVSIIFPKKINQEKIKENFTRKGFEYISSCEMNIPKGISTQYKSEFFTINYVEYEEENKSRVIISWVKNKK